MAASEQFKGRVVLPGEQDARQATLLIDRDSRAVTVRFDEPVAGKAEWKGADVQIAKRLKFYEVVFRTEDIPQESVELVWKCSAALDGLNLAGVVIARPNSLRITGEKGFILTGV